MSGEQKMNHMKKVVVPKMASLFQSHDQAEFAEFNCVTCHGKGAKQGSFKMPNPSLPVLDPTDQFAKAKQAHPAMLEFMMKQVTPTMAGLLGMQPYDPTTKQGFGCGNCHTMKR